MTDCPFLYVKGAEKRLFYSKKDSRESESL